MLLVCLDARSSIQTHRAYARISEGHVLNQFVKILVTFGSLASIGFGIWHFFVPRAWKWFSYIDANATELVAAVRAINVFFSLSLVLFGIVNILFHLRRQVKSILNHCDASRNKHFMGDKVDISAYLSTRFTLPWYSVWDVVCIRIHINMLYHSADHHDVPKFCKLATH